MPRGATPATFDMLSSGRGHQRKSPVPHSAPLSPRFSTGSAPECADFGLRPVRPHAEILAEVCSHGSCKEGFRLGLIPCFIFEIRFTALTGHELARKALLSRCPKPPQIGVVSHGGALCRCPGDCPCLKVEGGLRQLTLPPPRYMPSTLDVSNLKALKP